MTEKIIQPFILLIMNCQKYKEKALFQKNTWLNNIPENILYYHVVGDMNLNTEYKFDDIEKILWVKDRDEYITLPNKVITSFNAINDKYEFKYIFKTDDDQTCLDARMFFEIIPKLILHKIPKAHYGGKMIEVKTPHISEYYRIHPELPEKLIIDKGKYCSGRFYFLSREAVINLLFQKKRFSNEYLEDYAVGYYLNNEFKREILKVDSDKYFKDT